MALALVVELVVAASFGLGVQADAYFLALAVPLFVQEVVTAMVPQVLVPQLGIWYARDRIDLAAGAAIAYGLALVFFCAISGLCFFLIAPSLWAGLGSSFTALIQSLLIPLVIVAAIWPLAQALKWLLNVQRHYLLANSDWAVLSAVALLVLLMGRSGLGIAALAWGQVAGVCLYILFCLPCAMPNFRGADPKEALKAAGMLLRPSPLPALAAAAGSVPMLVARMTVAALGPGLVSALSYAFRIRSSFERLLFLGTGTAGLSEAARLSWNPTERRKVLAQSLSLTLIASVPVAVLLVTGPSELMGMVYSRGAFSAADATVASRLLPWYGIGLAVSALGRSMQAMLVLRVQLGWAMILKLLAVTAEIATMLIAVDRWGIVAPGIGWLLGNVVSAAGIWTVLRSEASALLRLVAPSGVRSVAAGLVALIVGQIGFRAVPGGGLLTLGVVLVTLLAYWITLLVLGSSEARLGFWTAGFRERRR
jgi:putative peptidoglycan lipid II flippase